MKKPMILGAAGLVALASVVGILRYSDGPKPSPDTPAASNEAQPGGAAPANAALNPPAPLDAQSRTTTSQPPANTATQADADFSADGPPPEPVNDELDANDSNEVMSMWSAPGEAEDIVVNGIPAKRMHANMEALDKLRVGRQLELPIPQRNESLLAEITSTHNQLDTIEVWKGPLVGGAPTDNVIITRGEMDTHVVIATRTGTYSAVINNDTGQVTLTDEGEINSRITPTEDGVPIPPLDLPTPEQPQSNS
ncbi:hypothetical protein O5O45_17565 [Hahella aquimaris]|uniref:hypothetical protein n=1 Tax=Hahella sp. HNIBRBA332 TaxID=3015983 RepID=UPI00273B4BA1|nr:hypothetical protein [Hahella sp. HNIBRBA332]WLQ11548.1 hypothetical protein O5O45_17565 [Hahella sp. HNIBRBA332]